MSSANQPTLGAGASSRARPPLPGWPALAPPPPFVLAEPWSLRPIDSTGTEIERVQRWMQEPHVEKFWDQAWPLETWSAEIRRQLRGDHSRPYVVALDGEPVAYVEVYRVGLDVVAGCWPFLPDEHCTHDLGVHLAIGDAARSGHGLGPRLLRAVVDGLFAAEPACARIIADPDAGHVIARRAFRSAGFSFLAEVDLPHKRAALMAFPRPTGPVAAGGSDLLGALQLAYDVVKPQAPRTLHPADRLADDLDLDSLDLVEVIDHLAPQVEPAATEGALEAIPDLRTLGDLLAALRRR